MDNNKNPNKLQHENIGNTCRWLRAWTIPMRCTLAAQCAAVLSGVFAADPSIICTEVRPSRCRDSTGSSQHLRRTPALRINAEPMTKSSMQRIGAPTGEMESRPTQKRSHVFCSRRALEVGISRPFRFLRPRLHGQKTDLNERDLFKIILCVRVCREYEDMKS